MPTDEELTDDELLSVPGVDIAPGRLTEFFTRRANVIHQRDIEELIREVTGSSRRFLMISRDADPREKERQQDKRRRQELEYERTMAAIRARSDRLLEQIEEQQRELEKRREEIEGKALRLHDGRRVYVDGDHYRDEQGRVLTGADEAEARSLHRDHPDASTWEDRRQAERKADELKRLRQKVLKDREDMEVDAANLSPDDMAVREREAGARMTANEKEFDSQVKQSAQADTDYGSADYLAAYDGPAGGAEGKSATPEFTKAAQGETATRKTTPESTNAPRPSGQGAPKV
jgi:hypothetical protein